MLRPMLASALVGVVPALLAIRFAPGPWTILAAAGAVLATTGLLVRVVRCARELARLQGREHELQTSAQAAETRIATLESKMREAATLDELTGTLNRRAFLTRMDEVIHRDARLQKPLAFLLIDIDRFRKINADAGRMVGDRVLRLVGRAIQTSTRGTDFVGRIGGDEFAVVMGECADPRPAIDRVFVALHGETTGGEKPLSIGVSIGAVTVAQPQRGVDPAEMFRLAEEAMASVRGNGGGLCGRRQYQVKDPRPVAAI